MGKVATSPLPPGGSPPLPSGGTASELAHKWARWLHHPCRLGGPAPHRSRAGGQNQKWPTNGQGGYITPAVWGVPTASERGDRIRSGPQMGKMATSPLPSGESPPLQSGGTESELAHKWARWLHHPCRLGGPHRSRAGGQNQKWPTNGQGGYITPAVRGVPTASERGDRIRSGPQMGKVATSPLPSGESPPLQSGGTESVVAHKWARWLHHPCRLGGPHRFRAGGQNQKWPTNGQGGYITPAVWGVPTAFERGDRIRSGAQVGKVATSPLPLGVSPPLRSGGTECEVAHKWAWWLDHPCRLGGPHRFRAGGQNQRWPTSGQGGYITPAFWGVPTASERGDRIRSGPQVGKVATSPLPPRGSPPLQSGGTESEVAHKWARWLHHPCRLGGPHRFRAGGQNQKWPRSGQGGYITPAAWGVPTASARGDTIRIGPQVGKVATSPLPPRRSPPLQSGQTESEVAHKWAWWLHHPCRLGGPQRFRAGDRIRIGPQVGKMATLPLPLGGSHRFRAGGQNQKWPTSGQGGYITPAASGVSTASERGDRIRSGPQVGKVATSPVPPGGSPPLQSGGTESEVAHKWARWLHHPCRLAGPHRFRAGRQKQSGPTSGHGGYITPAA